MPSARAAAIFALTLFVAPNVVRAQGAPPYRCGPDCATRGRWVLCNDSFDTTNQSGGGLSLTDFLEAACASFTAPAATFDVVGFSALFGAGETAALLVELFPETGTATVGPSITDSGAGIPDSATAGFSGLFFASQRMGQDFRICLRQQLDDPAQTLDARPLLFDADGQQGVDTTFVPGPRWQRSNAAGDFVLRAIIEHGDMTPWAPGGSCTGADAGTPHDASTPDDVEGSDAAADDASPGASDATSGDAGGEADAGMETKLDAGTATVGPSVTAISPKKGANVAPVDVTITGRGFVAGLTVRIGTILAEEVTVPGQSTILARVPANIAPGVYDVVVKNPDGESAILSEGYTVTDAAGNAPVSSKCTCTTPPREPAVSALIALLACALAWAARRPAARSARERRRASRTRALASSRS